MFTVETLKAFMHTSLLENFPDTTTENEDGSITVNDNATLSNAVRVANLNYNSLTGEKPKDAVIRFDNETYCLKVALIHIYDYVLHDNALLHNISISNMGISEQQVFEHFLSLKEMEQKDVNEMREQFLEEVKDKEVNSKYAPVMLHHVYGRRLNGNYF